MSAPQLPYSPVYIKVWTIFSIVLGLFLLSMFVFGSCYLHAGGVVWKLIRWIFSPII